MKPEIIQLPALHLLGLSARFIRPMSPGANNTDVIPKLWARFCPMIPTLPQPEDKYVYGAARCPVDAPHRNPDELEYLASINVSASTKPPPSLELWQISAGTYACFTHRGPVTKLAETINYAFGTWLPRSKFVHAQGPNLDRQDERFGDGGANCEFDFLIPVTPR